MKKRYCLDACIFDVEHKPERGYRPGVLDSVKTLMADVDAGKVYAVMPSTIAIELLDGSFEHLLRRADGRKGEVVDVDFKTSEIAREVRNKFTRKTRESEKILELPDCIYIATAIRYECEAVITRDGECNRRHNLLNVADEVFAAYKVKILHPKDAIDQQVMVFPSDEPERDEE